MKIPDLKNTFLDNVIKVGTDLTSSDSLSTINNTLKELPEDVIRRGIYKSPNKKLIGKKQIKKPTSKITTMKSIMDEKETNEVTASSSSGQFSAPLFSEPKEDMNEKWSEKYKKSIDCNNPKGFSQEAFCQGKKKKQMSEEKLKGGLSDNKTFENIAKKHDRKGYYDIQDMVSSLKKELAKGIKIEMEHTEDKKIAKEIALDHLYEDPNYYSKLKKIEKKEFKEATGSSSSGQYATPAAWAKTMNKKDWRGASKTQIPGGKFVQVKKKCKTFPYCNQGDIKALKLFENEQFKKIINNISKKHDISESVIKNILSYEYEIYLNQQKLKK